MKQQYVCGFLITYDMDRFLLIDKGMKKSAAIDFPLRLCGLGGKIQLLPELGISKNDDGYETPHEAMEREFHEESGTLIKKARWHCFMIKEYKEAKIYMMAAFCSPDEMIKIVVNSNTASNKVELPEGPLVIETLPGILFDGGQVTFDLPYILAMILREMRSGFFMKLDPEGVNSGKNS